MTVQKLSIQNLLLVGFTLFSMFFGAGNLIFPPDLAARAGTEMVPAMAGFLISAVGLPVLGVAAVAVSGGLEKLAGKVGKRFSLLFTLTAYLAIGPFLAIPRTASTSFEMTLLPILTGAGVHLGDYLGHTGITIQFFAQLGYSFVFFAVALLLAVHPETLSERLGKVTCPALLVLIAVLFTGRLIWPMNGVGETAAEFASGAAVRGFMEGYQTMDTLAALNFGIIISLNIRNKGISREDSVIRETVKAGLVAGIMLSLVYGALAHIGGPVGGLAGEGANGARILTFVAGDLFGVSGMMILGVIFFIACLNTCVGLICCCSQYFSTLIPGVSYRVWTVIFAVVSLLISSAGLDRILKYSVPVLNAVYPVAIVLIVLAFMEQFTGKRIWVYRLSILFTAAVSIVWTMDQASIAVSGLTAAVRLLPGYASGLGWLLPAVIGGLLGKMIPAEGERNKEQG